MLQIRRVKPEDINFILKLVEENNYSDDMLLSNIEDFLVCENNGIKCGCGCLIAHGNEGFIHWIIVSEEHRGRQLGSAITKALLNIAERKGIREVYAAGECKAFFISLGFEKYGSDETIDYFKGLLGDLKSSAFYRVSLEGYFKPCSQR